MWPQPASCHQLSSDRTGSTDDRELEPHCDQQLESLRCCAACAALESQQYCSKCGTPSSAASVDGGTCSGGAALEGPCSCDGGGGVGDTRGRCRRNGVLVLRTRRNGVLAVRRRRNGVLTASADGVDASSESAVTGSSRCCRCCQCRPSSAGWSAGQEAREGEEEGGAGPERGAHDLGKAGQRHEGLLWRTQRARSCELSSSARGGCSPAGKLGTQPAGPLLNGISEQVLSGATTAEATRGCGRSAGADGTAVLPGPSSRDGLAALALCAPAPPADPPSPFRSRRPSVRHAVSVADLAAALPLQRSPRALGPLVPVVPGAAPSGDGQQNGSALATPMPPLEPRSPLTPGGDSREGRRHVRAALSQQYQRQTSGSLEEAPGQGVAGQELAAISAAGGSLPAIQFGPRSSSELMLRRPAFAPARLVPLAREVSGQPGPAVQTAACLTDQLLLTGGGATSPKHAAAAAAVPALGGQARAARTQAGTEVRRLPSAGDAPLCDLVPGRSASFTAGSLSAFIDAQPWPGRRPAGAGAGGAATQRGGAQGVAGQRWSARQAPQEPGRQGRPCEGSPQSGLLSQACPGQQQLLLYSGVSGSLSPCDVVLVERAPESDGMPSADPLGPAGRVGLPPIGGSSGACRGGSPVAGAGNFSRLGSTNLGDAGGGAADGGVLASGAARRRLVEGFRRLAAVS